VLGRPVVTIRRLGLRGEQSPEDHEGAGDEREFRRAEEQQAGDLLILK